MSESISSVANFTTGLRSATRIPRLYATRGILITVTSGVAKKRYVERGNLDVYAKGNEGRSR